MGQENLRRQVESWNIVANSERTVDLPRVQDIESIMVELDAVVNLTVAGSAVRAFAPAQLIKTISVSADGKDVLDEVPFYFYVFGNYKRRFSREVTAPATAGTGSHTVRAVVFLDRANINGWRPKDTAFQAWAASLLQLRLTTGLATDLFTGTPTGTITSGTVRVSVISHRDDAEDKGEPKRISKRTKQNYVFTSSNSAYRFLLPTGNFIRLVGVCAKDQGEPSNTLINNLTFKIDGVDVRHALSFKGTRSANAADANVPLADVPSGFAFVDSSPRGKFSDYFDLRFASEAVLEVDHASATAGEIDLVVEEDIANVQPG